MRDLAAWDESFPHIDVAGRVHNVQPGDEMMQTSGMAVALFDEQPIIREFLTWVLGQHGVGVTAVTGGPEEFVRRLAAQPTHAVVGLTDDAASTRLVATEGLLTAVRQASPRLPIVVLGPDRSPELNLACARLRLHLLGRTSASLEMLLRALGADAGPARVPARSRAVERLSTREREVLSHVGAGHDNLKIAALLGITEHTVKAHMVAIYRKTQVENRVELALLARQAGVVDLDDDGPSRFGMEAGQQLLA
jgi:DNA-binding NarL/FixJ family response regulator